MQIDLSRFRDTFFQECEEHLAAMEAGLLSLEENSGDSELLNAVFRGAHSIKGSSGTFGLERMAGFTHSMESLLDQMRSGTVKVDRQRVDLLLRSVDVLKGLTEAARAGVDPPAESDQVRALLVAAIQPAFNPSEPEPVAAAGEGAPQVYRVRFYPSADIFRQGMDPALVLRELESMADRITVTADWSRLPALEDMDPETCYAGWTIRLETKKPIDEVRDLFAFVEDGAELSIAEESHLPLAAPEGPEVPRTPAVTQAHTQAVAKTPARESASIRVSTGKVDTLIDLVGEMVIAHSMAAEVLNGFSPERLPELQEAFQTMQRYTRELQERVMGIRMVPVGTVFSRFPRMVRDIAASLGKQVQLETFGEETELDKSVVERMTDPLTHLVRNAIDHGIEPASDRIAAGKPAQGRLSLGAYHQGGSVIIEVGDDGRGLDADRIRKKARAAGLLPESEEPDAATLHALIFEPGFSTADKVSDLSGRGVGMDVVKKVCDTLNASIAVDSRPGKGLRISIKLPLTLAILDGLLLRVGDQVYVMPLLPIVESVKPRKEQLCAMAGKGETLVVRGEPVALIRLSRLFGIPNAIEDPVAGLAVIVEHQGKRYAVLVDQLLGQQQVVIKSLETHFRKVEGVVGATILGDGRAALILDVTGVVQMSRTMPVERTAA